MDTNLTGDKDGLRRRRGNGGGGCGMCGCEPSVLQVFASPRVFMVLLSVSVCLVACLCMGYLASVLPTVQKRYHLSAPETDWIAASYGVGLLLAILFVGYFGHSGHRPLIIGIGLLFCAVGGFLAALPQFVLPPLREDPAWQAHANRSVQTEFCHLTEGVASQDDCPTDQISDNHIRATTTALMSIGLLICGAGMAPLLTLGTTYIDDGIGSHSTAIYLGVVAASLALGPCVGYVAGAAIVTTLHVDYYSAETYYPVVEPDHPYWIGAWWLGFLIFPSVLLALCVPFFFFPKYFPKPSGRKGRYMFKFQYRGDEDSDTWKELPGKLKALFCNGTLMVICIGAGAELAVNTGIMLQIPHYLETQMQASELYSSLLSAVVMFPMSCLGIFTGGYVIKKLKLSSRKCTRVIMYSDLTTMLVYFFLFLFGCNIQFLPNIFYPGSHNSTNANAHLVNNQTNLVSVNLTTACNYRCDCDTLDYYPVCGDDGVTYFSPCHAGCTVKDPGNVVGPSGQPVKKYSNCSCVAQKLIDDVGEDFGSKFTAHGGVCDNHCTKILPFTIVFFGLACFFGNIPWIPAVMLVLRTMAPRDRSVSVSMEYMFMHAFGFIITPLVLMVVTDSTCFLRHAVCGKGDVCLVYDILTYRFAFLAMAAGLKFVSLLCFMATGSFIQGQYKARRRAAAAAAAARINSALDELDSGSVDDQMEDDGVELADDGELEMTNKINVYVEQPTHQTRAPENDNAVPAYPKAEQDSVPWIDYDVKPRYKNTRFAVVHVDADGSCENGPNQIQTTVEVNHDIPTLTNSPSVKRRHVTDHDNDSTAQEKGNVPKSPKVSIL